MSLPSELEIPDVDRLIQQEKLPDDFKQTVESYYWPLTQQVAQWAKAKPLFLAINGGQGTGKSTMALFLRELLQAAYGLKVAVLSIDDLYLTKDRRSQLSEEIHPLLATRGVPGTHDPALGLEVVERLLNGSSARQTKLPRFNKAVDDRVPEEEWPVFLGKADVVILEGWCVGARAQKPDDLLEPVNELEANEDTNGVWRRYVNERLSTSYRPLFDRIDHVILLRAPSMECIRQWRGQQEAKLQAKVEAEGGDLSGIMDDVAIDRFIAHYQRLTEYQWKDLSECADVVVHLAEDHHIQKMSWRGK